MNPSPLGPLPSALQPQGPQAGSAISAIESVTGENGRDDEWAPWLRLLLENANDLVYLHEHALEGKLLYVNRKLEEVTGWRREEVLGTSVLNLLAPEYRTAALSRRDRSGQMPLAHRYECELLCRDGSRVPIEVHSTAITQEGRIIGWQGIARDIRERRRAQARMAAVYETARQIAGILNLDAVLSLITERAAAITGASHCALWLADDGYQSLRCASSTGAGANHPPPPVAVASEHPIAQSLQLGRPVVLGSNGSSATGASSAASTVCVPLESTGGALGVLSLSYGPGVVLEPDEMALLSTLASHAAAAIANARLFEAQRRKAQESAAIGQIGMIAGTLDIDAVLQVAGAYVYELFEADLTAFLLVDEGRATVRATFARERDDLSLRLDLGEQIVVEEHPVLVESVLNQRTVLLEGVATHPLSASDAPLRDSGLSSVLVVPLVPRDRAVGVLVVGYADDVPVTDTRVRLAETLAQQAAMAVENATMFEAVSRAKREWEATFDAITDPVCIFSAQGELLRANRAAADLFGLSLTESRGRRYQDLMHAGKALEPGDVFLECLGQGQPVTREVDNLAVPGVFRVAAYPLFDGAGKCVGVVEYLKDITEQAEMQARLYQSARLAGVGELAAGVVHNFKNVLMGVSGTLDVSGMLLERGGDVNEVRKRLLDAQEYVYRGNEVLERLLNFARGTAQKVTAVSLGPLIGDVVSLCKAHPAGRNVRVRTELPPDIPSVQADASQLHEVLMNLVLNAMQAISGPGAITIRGERHGDMVNIEVADTGCGIPPEDLERVFEAFFTRRHHGPPGTGVGLSSSLRMVRAMGGDITVVSQVGEGSTFTVSLPAAPDSPPEA